MVPSGFTTAVPLLALSMMEGVPMVPFPFGSLSLAVTLTVTAVFGLVVTKSSVASGGKLVFANVVLSTNVMVIVPLSHNAGVALSQTVNGIVTVPVAVGLTGVTTTVPFPVTVTVTGTPTGVP